METRATRAGSVTTSVLVADASAATRAGVRAAIEPLGFAVAAEAADARGAVEGARSARPDVCLLALDLPGDCLEAVRAILDDAPGARVVVLADDDDDARLVPALAAGATGYTVRAGAVERLPEVLSAAVGGYAHVVAGVLTRLAEQAQRERRSELWRTQPRAPLSPRERQVLEALREGASTLEIATRLGLSAVTVRRYVSGVVRKAGVPDRDALRAMLRDRQAS
jgi:NarL family two-component system response regulator LiaR